MSNNPLQQYFRSIKFYITLPSGTSYYDDDVISFTDSDEVGVMAMTAKDEVYTKNPDALLNGEALALIISSCVPSVKQPKKLLTNDIDALMIAIRHATYGEDLEVNMPCPECEHPNTFTVNISQSLSNIGKLESEYFLGTKDGIKIYIKPFSYTDTVRALQAQFDQYKIAAELGDQSKSEESRMKTFSKTFKALVELNTELLVNCIIKIDNDAGELSVTNQEHISEYIQNMEKSTFAELDTLIKDVNAIGVNKTFDAVCDKCEHKWEAEIDFNPVNFFTESL